MFGIFFDKSVNQLENGETNVLAKIVINKYTENTYIPINYWAPIDYQNSWFNSLQEGLLSKTHSILVTSMGELSSMNFIFLWNIFYDGEMAFIQNEILFLQELDDFDINKINDYLTKRNTVTEDGFKISEWSIEIKEIIKFKNKLYKLLNEIT